MKRFYLLGCLVVALCLCACEKVSVGDGGSDVRAMRSVQFVMKGLTVEYATRATLASEGMTDLWVWEGETLLCHQSSTDAGFGAPTISLTIGAHDLTFVASKSDGQSWANGQWSCSKVKDTFGTVLTYTVSGSSSSKQVQLARVNGKVQWTIEDALPEDVSTVDITLSQCYGLDADLNGISSADYKPSFNVAGYAGTKGVALSAMVLPADHANGSDITAKIEAKSATKTLCSYSNDVTVKANQVCNIRGSFFSGGGEHAVSLTSDWGATTDYDVH